MKAIISFFFLMIFVLNFQVSFSVPFVGNSNIGAIKTGAEQTEKYLSLLKGKRVAIVANQTSIIGKTSLVDSLKTLGVKIVKIFGPEHG
ncbi:MAG: DUF1343 domain-containing protein, partial [Bacteroidota bacterium]|nr:DUF1343 domain-containing protein [Bacteroidota bacterium]